MEQEGEKTGRMIEETKWERRGFESERRII